MFTPDVAPLWLRYTPSTKRRLDAVLRGGIAVLDTRSTRVRGEPARAIGQLISLACNAGGHGVHKEILAQALAVTQGLAASVVVSAENGQHLSLFGPSDVVPGSPLETAFGQFGGHYYSAGL